MARGRPTTADTCRDPHARRGKIILCGRRLGHTGDHGHGKFTWPRRIAPPPPGSSAAVSPLLPRHRS